jgi:hypothetical protein
MKKVMLGLVMVVMLMSMVGCGTTKKNEEVNTEVKVDVNGNEIVNMNTEKVDNTIVTAYGVIKRIEEPKFFEGNQISSGYVQLEFLDENGYIKYAMPSNLLVYEERFANQTGKIVKATLKVENTIVIEVLSVEIIEE